MPLINENYIQFFTAVCTDWLPLLQSDECKDVIIGALKYRVQTKEVGVAGFVIMPNPPPDRTGRTFTSFGECLLKLKEKTCNEIS